MSPLRNDKSIPALQALAPLDQKCPKLPDVLKNRIKDISDFNKSPLLFSFEILDTQHKYFNIGGICVNWVQTAVEKLSEVNKVKVIDLQSGKYTKNGPFRFHNHKNGNPRFEPPDNIEPEDFYQIRFGTNSGGIHGLLVENVFYIKWVDPHHNMYPHKGKNPVVYQIPGECCKERDAEIEELNQKIEKLEKKNAEYEALLEKETNPQ